MFIRHALLYIHKVRHMSVQWKKWLLGKLECTELISSPQQLLWMERRIKLRFYPFRFCKHQENLAKKTLVPDLLPTLWISLHLHVCSVAASYSLWSRSTRKFEKKWFRKKAVSIWSCLVVVRWITKIYKRIFYLKASFFSDGNQRLIFAWMAWRSPDSPLCSKCNLQPFVEKCLI